MKKLLPMIILFFLCLCFFVNMARADKFDFKLPGKFETQSGINFGNYPLEPKLKNSLYGLNLRLRNWHTPIAISGQLTRQGWQITALLDVVHGENWRIYFNLGKFTYFGSKYLNNPNVKRSWDLAIGGGIEILTWKKIVITFDSYIFLPNPMELIPDYGDFYRLFGKEAERKVALCIGANWKF